MLSYLTILQYEINFQLNNSKQLDRYMLQQINKMKLQHYLSITLLTILLSTIGCKLVIQSPPDLKAKLQTMYPGGIHYSVANYGDVPFGKSVAGTIYLSSFLENCQFEELDVEAQRSINKIVLSTRGDCSFTKKSINSQKQGAKLAIIADNQMYEDPGLIVMVDDGKGPQVKIPTILISHQAGQLIIDSILNKKQNVSLTLTFQTYKKPVADVTIWMKSYDRKSYILIRDLEPYLSRINESIKLSVYHPTSYCKECIQTDCYMNRNYCVNTGFYGYMIEGYGRAVIQQQIREEIIMKRYPQLWWKYVQRYDEECEREDIEDCSIESMKAVGIDADAINKEVQASFFQKTYKDDASGEEKTTLDNKILEKNDELRKKSGLLLYPGIVVNNITYRGNLEALQIFQMICESLETQPEGCNLDIKPQTHSVWKYVLAVSIIFIAMMAFLIFCYRRQARRQISKNLNNEVNDLVNQYITMYQAQRFESHELAPTGSSTISNEKK